MHVDVGKKLAEPVGHKWPTACVCIAHEQRMVFKTVNGWKQSEEQFFVTYKIYMKFKFQYP